MTDVIPLYGRIADRFGELLVSCPADRWTSPSPCPGWSAWDVAAHVVRNHRRAVAGLDGSEFTQPTPGEDVLAAWQEATDAIRAALLDPHRSAALLGEEFGSISFADFVVRMACADTLIHTWDFARATGQEERLDPEAVDLAAGILAPEDEDIRMPNAFGGRKDSTPDADAQTRLLNFLGRTV